MKRLIAAVATVLMMGSPAYAHGTWGYDWWPTIKERQQKRIVRTAHDVFRSHGMAHWALLLWDCEAQFRWWLKGSTYWGFVQADRSFRDTFGGIWWDGWSVREQAKATKRGFRARGGDPWPNCPNESRG